MSVKQQSRKSHITVSSIRSLQPDEKDWFIRDTTQQGFQIKVSPSGKSVYQVEARLGGTGKVKKYKLGNVGDIDLPKARKLAKDALDKIRSGIDPLQEKRKLLHDGKTLRQLMDDYFSVRPLKPRTVKRYEYLAKTQFKSWLGKRVADITKHEIQDWYARGSKKKAMTDAAYRFLTSLMTFAMGREIIAENPCRLVTNAKMRYQIKSRTDHIEVNIDLPKFLYAFIDYKYLRDSQKVARDAILLILTTGLRLNEACALQWKSVDFKRKIITVFDTKNGRDHVVPMTPLIYAMLRYREENNDKSSYVFRIKGGGRKSGHITSFQKTLKNICTQAGITVVSAHDLRRTFATVLNSIGVGHVDMKQLMNHKAKDITGEYIQADIEKLRGILFRVVDYYDLKIPFFKPKQGCSKFATNVLRHTIYNKGTVVPTELTDPMAEDEEWLKAADDDVWED